MIYNFQRHLYHVLSVWKSLVLTTFQENPPIVNGEINCILCEECLETCAHNIQDQIEVKSEASIKVEVEEGFSLCPCGCNIEEN